MTNLEAKTTFELNAMIADIQIELKLREMIEAVEAKEEKKGDFKTADISSGAFTNPSTRVNQHYICNRIDLAPFVRSSNYTDYKYFLDATNEAFAYEISRGDILEFISFDGKLKNQENINANYVLILNLNSSEVEYQEFNDMDDAFAAFKAMPEDKADKTMDELSEKEIVDLIFKKDRSKNDFQTLYNHLSDITKNVYRDVLKANGFKTA